MDQDDITLFKKKRNRDTNGNASTIQPTVEEHSDKKEKKKKKKQKKQAEEEATQLEQPQLVEDSSTSNGQQNGEEKKKKKKHKKNNREEQVQQEDQPPPAVQLEEITADTNVEKKKKKKKHKNKEQNVQQVETEEITDQQSEVVHSNGHSSKKGGIRFNFFSESAGAKSFSDAEVNEFRTKHRMSVTFMNNTSGEKTESEPQDYSKKSASTYDDMKPIRSFDELIVPDSSMKLVTKKFTTPTPIQSQCWPFVMSGRDMIGIAETGSGKTLAFVIPALAHIKDQKPVGKNEGPVVLILSPTRELAIQTYEVSQDACNACGLRSACFFGGVSKETNYSALAQGVHLLVATPGRLLDLLNEEAVNLNRVTYLVLDEADRMLDNGFEKDVRAIVKLITETRQTIMFSATWPQDIQNLAHTFLKNPVRVTIGSADLTANHRVSQTVEVIQNPRDKERRLLQLLQQFHKSRTNKILIFILYKKEAPFIEGLLSRNGYKVGTIHGDMSQSARIASLNAFKSGETPLLVATDVAARGLDIPNVEYVINYTFPLTVEDYVHRIGRTGRAGKTGVSHTFFTEYDKQRAGELVAVLQEANATVPDELRKLSSFGTAKKEHKLYGSHFKETDNTKPMPKKSHMKFDE